MLIQLQGNIPIPFYRALNQSTNHAAVRPSDFVYDTQAGVVSAGVRLATVTSRRFLGGFRYSKNTIPASLVIRHVTDCKIFVAVGFNEQEVQLLFGVAQLQDHRLYLCSAEEQHGKPCFSAEIAFSELELELSTEI